MYRATQIKTSVIKTQGMVITLSLFNNYSLITGPLHTLTAGHRKQEKAAAEVTTTTYHINFLTQFATNYNLQLLYWPWWRVLTIGWSTSPLRALFRSKNLIIYILSNISLS